LSHPSLRQRAALFFIFSFAGQAFGQAVPYARSFPMPRVQVEQALKDLQAYSGQKLPVLDGFVSLGDKPLDRYERGFYQFSIELVPGDSGGTIVRLAAKITAWYADRDVTKSGYQVLPSNGRLELDFLDRLEEKLTGKPVAPPASNSVQAPQPKLDLSSARTAATMASPLPSSSSLPPDEVASLRNQRVAAEKRVQQLTAELQNLQEIKRSQVHPKNLLIVKKSGTPIYAKNAESSRVLFQAAANDEFEFLDAEGEWLHISISGDSRGYVRKNAVEIPETIAARLETSAAPSPEEKFVGFRIEREETSLFPGDWAPLKGKTVKIFTVLPISQDAKDTGPAIRVSYCIALFEKGSREATATTPPVEGVVVIFDSADGAIAGATLADIRKLASGAVTRQSFWQQIYLDPPDAFTPAAK
jgi:hypothetical protein